MSRAVTPHRNALPFHFRISLFPSSNILRLEKREYLWRTAHFALCTLAEGFSSRPNQRLFPASSLCIVSQPIRPSRTTMKLTTLLLMAPLALAAPPATIEKRAVSATVIVDGLRYRTCPKTSCSAPGQFAKGTKISLQCYTRDGTETINGDKGWAKIASGTGKGNWVALAYAKYISWSGEYDCRC